MKLELEGKVALVTGSSAGIGHAIASALCNEGAKVVLNGRDDAKLNQAVVGLPGSTGFVADVSNPDECIGLVNAVVAKYGLLDVLVCNVGSGRSVPPGQEDPREWDRVLSVNLRTTTQMVWAARSELIKSKGTVICISSICGIEALGCPVAYAAAKAAVESFVRTSARPLGKHGVRINSIAPGNIVFPGSVWERKLREAPQEVEAMLQREVSLGRLGRPEEVASLAAFLASPVSAFITGTTYVVDGGQLRS